MSKILKKDALIQKLSQYAIGSAKNVPDKKTVNEANSLKDNDSSIQSNCLNKQIISATKLNSMNVTQIIDLYTTGNLTVQELQKWCQCKGITPTFTEEKNYVTVSFTYIGKKYTIKCNTKAVMSQTDSAQVTTYTKDDLINNYKFDAQTIDKYFDIVECVENGTKYNNQYIIGGNAQNQSYISVKYALKPNCKYENATQLKNAIFMEYKNNLIINNFLSGNTSTTINGRTSENGIDLYRTQNGTVLTEANFTQYTNEIHLATEEEADILREQALAKLITEFSTGNLKYTQVPTILDAIGVTNYKQTTVGQNYKFSFTYNGKNYSIICNKKAAESGIDDNVVVTYSNKELNGLDKNDIDKYYTSVSTKNGIATVYVSKFESKISDLLKDIKQNGLNYLFTFISKSPEINVNWGEENPASKTIDVTLSFMKETAHLTIDISKPENSTLLAQNGILDSWHIYDDMNLNNIGYNGYQIDKTYGADYSIKKIDDNGAPQFDNQEAKSLYDAVYSYVKQLNSNIDDNVIMSIWQEIAQEIGNNSNTPLSQIVQSFKEKLQNALKNQDVYNSYNIQPEIITEFESNVSILSDNMEQQGLSYLFKFISEHPEINASWGKENSTNNTIELTLSSDNETAHLTIDISKPENSTLLAQNGILDSWHIFDDMNLNNIGYNGYQINKTYGADYSIKKIDDNGAPQFDNQEAKSLYDAVYSYVKQLNSNIDDNVIMSIWQEIAQEIGNNSNTPLSQIVQSFKEKLQNALKNQNVYNSYNIQPEIITEILSDTEEIPTEIEEDIVTPEVEEAYQQLVNKLNSIKYIPDGGYIDDNLKDYVEQVFDETVSFLMAKHGFNFDFAKNIAQFLQNRIVDDDDFCYSISEYDTTNFDKKYLEILDTLPFINNIEEVYLANNRSQIYYNDKTRDTIFHMGEHEYGLNSAAFISSMFDLDTLLGEGYTQAEKNAIIQHIFAKFYDKPSNSPYSTYSYSLAIYSWNAYEYDMNKNGTWLDDLYDTIKEVANEIKALGVTPDDVKNATEINADILFENHPDGITAQDLIMDEYNLLLSTDAGVRKLILSLINQSNSLKNTSYYEYEDFLNAFINFINEKFNLPDTEPPTLTKEAIQLINNSDILKNLESILDTKDFKNYYYIELIKLDGVIDDFSQGGSGDCWLLSGLEAMRASTAGSQILADAMTINDDGSVTIKFVRPYRYRGDLSEGPVYITISAEAIYEARCSGKYSCGDWDVLVWELAFSQYIGNNKSAMPGIGGDPNICGGWQSEVISALTENYSVSGIWCKDDLIAFLNNHIQDLENFAFWFCLEGCVLSTAESVNNMGTFSFTSDRGYGHAFAIVGFDIENETITVVNPWYSGTKYEITMDDFFNFYFMSGAPISYSNLG